MLGRYDEDGWRLLGVARQLANFVAASFVAVAVVVAVADRSMNAGWDTPLLQDWSLVPHALAIVGLVYLAKVHRSRAFWTLGILLGLIFAQEAFHVLNFFTRTQVRAAVFASRHTGIEWDVLSKVVLYGFVVSVGVVFLAFAYWQASRAERRVVRNLALLLLIGGFFGTVVSSLAALDDPRRLTFVEELGESCAYALMAGYVSGLVYVTAGPRLRRGSRVRIRERP